MIIKYCVGSVFPSYIPSNPQRNYAFNKYYTYRAEKPNSALRELRKKEVQTHISSILRHILFLKNDKYFCKTSLKCIGNYSSNDEFRVPKFKI